MNFNKFIIVFSVFSVSSLVKSSPDLADIGPAPEVELIDAGSKPFRLSDLRGKAVLVSFVYTTCNGSCPATTAELVRVRKTLGEAGLWGKSVEFVSITLDPTRDTPETLAAYAHAYRADDEAWHFLTGSTARVDKILADWDMWAKRDAKGVLDHPSRIFLVDPKGRRREIYNLQFLKPEAVLADIRSVLAEEGR